MSDAIRDQIKNLQKRGVPVSDPRIQGLQRRLERSEQATLAASETTEKLKSALGDLIDERR